ncbi:MAG: YqjK family protein [Rhodocyclaceae bacterium]|nr:YqjK family protein [Rhodocyclaceae bacterium]
MSAANVKQAQAAARGNADIEFALKKQRLQLRSAALRAQFAEHAAAFVPVFAAGDRLRDGVLWLRRHPEVTVAAGVALAVVRPRVAFRWARRGVVAWQAWSRANAWLESHRHER